MDNFIGEIRILPYTYAPLEWAFCNGQRIAIAQGQTLYAIIGSTYGGDNKTYFNLPNLMQAGQPGAAPMGTGTGKNLTPRRLGPNAVGVQQVQLVVNQMPLHNHPFKVEGTTVTGDLLASPANAYVSRGYVTGTTAAGFYTYTALPTDQSKLTTFREPALSIGGQNGAHNNMQPYQALNFCISLSGLYPVRP
jgi:microcystin-dependent protein